MPDEIEDQQVASMDCGTCTHCGNTVAEDDFSDWHDDSYCRNCLDVISFVCDYCGDRESTEGSHWVDGTDSVCEYCYVQHYFRCDRCRESYDRSECHEHEGEYLCEYCYDRSREVEDDELKRHNLSLTFPEHRTQ